MWKKSSGTSSLQCDDVTEKAPQAIFPIDNLKRVYFPVTGFL